MELSKLILELRIIPGLMPLAAMRRADFAIGSEERAVE